MSEIFDKKITAIKAAYSDKLQRGKGFTADWFKVSKSTIRPVLESAQDKLSDTGLRLEIAEEGNELVFMVIKPGKGGVKKLFYRPKIYDGVIVMTTVGTGCDTSQAYALELIDVTLIENHVEEFLKDALKLKDLT